MEIQFRRPDGSFVAIINGLPYHVTYEDPLFEAAQEAGAEAPLEPDLIESTDAAAQQLTFAQLLIGLVSEEWITEVEGEVWLAGTVPAAVSGLIATLPEGQRFAALARASRPSVVLRSDPLVNALAAAQDKSQADMDAFFTTYAEA